MKEDPEKILLRLLESYYHYLYMTGLFSAKKRFNLYNFMRWLASRK